MVPHPLIHLKLARIRCDELLTTRHRHSRIDPDAIRDEPRRGGEAREGIRGSAPCCSVLRAVFGGLRQPSA